MTNNKINEDKQSRHSGYNPAAGSISMSDIIQLS